MPRFFRWGGGTVSYSWSFGWLTDEDIVAPVRKLPKGVYYGMVMSPVCKSRPGAFVAFLLKMLLVRIDYNLRALAAVREAMG
jgi:hypothetical protein